MLAPSWRTQPMNDFLDSLHTPSTEGVHAHTYESVMESIPEVDRGGAPLCERAVVASIIENGGKRGASCETISSADFLNKPLGRVFDMLMSIDGPVDLPIAVVEAEKRGLDKLTGSTGFSVYLASLLDDRYDPDNIDHYCRRVKQASVARTVAAGLEKMRMERATRMAR